jgi:tetratricopeptide (TPR) repeat protein
MAPKGEGEGIGGQGGGDFGGEDSTKKESERFFGLKSKIDGMAQSIEGICDANEFFPPDSFLAFLSQTNSLSIEIARSNLENLDLLFENLDKVSGRLFDIVRDDILEAIKTFNDIKHQPMFRQTLTDENYDFFVGVEQMIVGYIDISNSLIYKDEFKIDQEILDDYKKLKDSLDDYGKKKVLTNKVNELLFSLNNSSEEQIAELERTGHEIIRDENGIITGISFVDTPNPQPKITPKKPSKLKKKTEKEKQTLLLLQAADLLYKKGELEAALKIYKEIVEMNPKIEQLFENIKAIEYLLSQKNKKSTN